MKPRRRLFYKYVVPIIAIVVVALSASGAISIYFSYQETRNALIALQREKAAAAAARIENFVREIEHQIGWTALPQIAEGANPLELRRFDYVKLLRQVPAITEVGFIDRDGREQVRVSRLAMDVLGAGGDLSQDPRFVGARTGKIYFGPVYFRKETEPYMAIAMRAGREGAGVTAVEVNLKFIWEVVQQIKIGKKGHAYVVDKDGHLVAHPDISLVLQKTDLSMLPQVKGAIAGLAAAGDEGQETAEARDRAGGQVLTAHARIDPLEWTVFVEQPIAEAYAPLYAPLIRIGILLLLGLVLSLLASLALARYMVRPINALREGAEAIGAGNLDQKIDVRTGDELQDLAEQFNSMATKLRESYAGLERKVEHRTAELKEALEYQHASAGILGIIASSVKDTQPVFDAIAKAAASVIQNARVQLFLVRGAELHHVGGTGLTHEQRERLRGLYPAPLGQTSYAGKAVLEKRVVHVADVEADRDRPELSKAITESTGLKAILAVPMIRDGEAIGCITTSFIEPGAFSDKQIALLKSFSDQAVIAIENVRLFNETAEALDQQTATSEILRVISSSPTDVQPVFEAIAQSGLHLFEDARVWVVLRDGDMIRAAAISERDPDRIAKWRAAFPTPLTHEYLNASAILDTGIVDIEDVEQLPEPLKPGTANFAATGYRAITITPMMRGEEAIGAIGVARLKPGALSSKQIALLKTFADQAVIAIENVRLFNDIQDKGRQLEIANRHKSEFLANMSHELRTPLNAIIGFSEVLGERYFGELNPKQLEYANDIHSSGKHLLSLINDILDLSKIEAGRMELDLAEFDMPSALQNAMTLVRERAQRHGIKLDLNTDPALGQFYADERKFKQIMLNLLSNAVKFTPEGGRVGVTAKPNGTAVEIAVADSGVGIAAEDQEAIFEEFKQVGTDYTKKAEGTGLGLALTRRFIELHGGAIRVISAPGKGSTFTFTLPIRHGQ
ncbi:MAG: ATP-binding protein [Pseudomonadota bacterium]